MTEADKLLRLYHEARAEFERIAHSETIMSDEYEAARERAKAALRRYQDFKSILSVAEGQYDAIGWRPGR